MTQKWNLIVDAALCEDCHNCTLAVKDEYCGNDFPGYAASQPLHGHEWIKIHRKVRGQIPHVDVSYLPTMCNHCDAAPCLAKAGDSGAVSKRPDGIVIIDPVKAKGRRDLVDACPYGAIWWNEELGLPQHWIFDAHLLDKGWTQPRCAQVCPTGAITAVKLDDEAMRKRAQDEQLQVLKPELGTSPRVYYRNLYRFTAAFLAGSVVGQVGNRTECVEGASVSLRGPDGKEQVCRSDAFGDFKFDHLPVAAASYQLKVTHPDYPSREISVQLTDSRSLDPIQMGAASARAPASKS
jgi:Fe-S-cluster-containing dehydrogenase component